jgi:hypothetical protein
MATDRPTYPMDQAELRLAAEAIAAIDAAGELDELKDDIGATAGEQDCPRSVKDLLRHRSLNQAFAVERVATELAGLLDVSHEAALEAAASIYLKTHRQIVLDLIADRAKAIARQQRAR